MRLLCRFADWWVFMNGPRSKMLGTLCITSWISGVLSVFVALAFGEWAAALKYSAFFVLGAVFAAADVVTDVLVLRAFDRRLAEMDRMK